jgi:phage tail-like protein
MAIFQGNRYTFHTPAQWRSGSFDNFGTSKDGLVAAAAFGIVKIEGSADERDALPAIDPCGHLYWLRAGSGELVRHYDFGNETVGPLLGAGRAKKLVIGFDLLWVLTDEALHRYAAGTLQYLGSITPPPGHVFTSIAGDGGDGLWALAIAGGKGVLLRYDGFGCRCGREVKLEDVSGITGVAASMRGDWVVVLTAAMGASGAGKPDPRKAWKLIVVGGATHKVLAIREFIAGPNEGVPSLIAADAYGRLHVATAGAGSVVRSFNIELARLADADTAILELIAHREIPSRDAEGGARAVHTTSDESWQLQAMAASDRIVIAGPEGLAWLSETELGTEDRDEIVSTFVTPILVSPDGLGNRWNAADLDVVFGDGTSLEIAVVASRRSSELGDIDTIFADNNLARKVTYAGNGGEPGLEKLRVLLDELPETHLRMRIRFRAAAAAVPPRLKSLSVFYPEHSYLEFLPAIYRENVASAAAMRRFLAPVEALFDEIDATIDELPRRIDPSTAPPSLPGRNDKRSLPTWHAFLLRWLGFPPVENLGADIVETLLKAAPKLLSERGTLRALRRVLDILTDHHASVQDSAAMPRPWILPKQDAFERGPRLGSETLIIEARISPLRLGRTKLGEAHLNNWCFDPVPLIERSNGEVTITVGIEPSDREQQEAIIRSFLALFVPAHCRLRLVVVPLAQWQRAVGIETGIEIAADDESPATNTSRVAEQPGGRLGSTTDLGCWQLPKPAYPAALLNRTAIANGPQHLN